MPGVAGIGDYSEAVMPASLITLPSRRVSSSRSFAKPCGELAMMAVSVAVIFYFTLASTLESLNQPLALLMNAVGLFVGASRPSQLEYS